MPRLNYVSYASGSLEEIHLFCLGSVDTLERRKPGHAEYQGRDVCLRSAAQSGRHHRAWVPGQCSVPPRFGILLALPASSLATLMFSILGEDAGRVSPEPWSGSLEWSQVANAFCALRSPVQCGRIWQGGGARVHLDWSPSRQEVMPPGLISAAVACLAWFRQTGRCPQGDLPDSESLGTEVFTPWGGGGRQGQDTSC